MWFHDQKPYVHLILPYRTQFCLINLLILHSVVCHINYQIKCSVYFTYYEFNGILHFIEMNFWQVPKHGRTCDMSGLDFIMVGSCEHIGFMIKADVQLSQFLNG